MSPVREVAREAPIKLNRHEQHLQQRREKREALFEAVRAAYQRGLTNRAITRELGITRTTVRRFLKADEFPERAPRRRPELDSFREYLEKRWAEGSHNASQLCRELRQHGYGGQRSRVKEYVQPWRAKSSPPRSKRRRTLPKLRLVAFWLTKPPMQRSPDEQRCVDAVTASHAQVATAEHPAQQFRPVFKERNSDALKSWLARSFASQIGELKCYVAGVQRDYEAVAAAVASEQGT